MKIKLESEDDLPLSKILNIPICVKLLDLFFKKIATIIHKSFYTSVFMNINMIEIKKVNNLYGWATTSQHFIH